MLVLITIILVVKYIYDLFLNSFVCLGYQSFCTFHIHLFTGSSLLHQGLLTLQSCYLLYVCDYHILYGNKVLIYTLISVLQ